MQSAVGSQQSEDGAVAFGRSWVVTAAWAHPFWPQYLFLLYDLTTDTGTPPVLHREGMTHELLVYALDPKHGLWASSRKPLSDQEQRMFNLRYLTPANHGYQFPAADDAAAEARVQALVDAVLARSLSPDTDFRSAWDGLFHDGVSLRRR